MSSINKNDEACVINNHIGDFASLVSCQYNTNSNLNARMHEFIEDYINLIKFCINSIGKPVANCFTQNINLFRVNLNLKFFFVFKNIS